MQTMKSVDAETLQKWIEKDEAVLVDVREVGEHKTKAIRHSRNIPLSHVTLEKALLPENRHKKMVLHCQSGRRSQLAGKKLMQQGATCELYNLEGGIVAWEQAGLPTMKQGKKVLPLDRQVQLVVGIVILTGLSIGYWLNPYGYLLSAFMGAGLTMASITGWCGLTHVLKVMPWNRG